MTKYLPTPKRYCTFWIPNVTHNNFQIIKSLVKSEIAQRDSDVSYQIKSNITKLNRSANAFSIRLYITEYASDKTDFSYVVDLKSVDSCISGLLEFEYSLNLHYSNKFYRIINHAYRTIVQHFHQHIYHAEQEGVKQAYCSDKLCKLNQPDNEALVFYLKQIHDLISVQVNVIHAISPLLNKDNDKISTEGIKARSLEMERFYVKCENLRGQMPFFHSLLNSPYNISCHITAPAPTSQLEKELHTIAHNIANLSYSILNLFEKIKTDFYIANINNSFDIQFSIREIASENKQLIQKVDESNALSEKLGRRSLKISIWMGALSLLLGLISIILSVLH